MSFHSCDLLTNPKKLQNVISTRDLLTNPKKLQNVISTPNINVFCQG